MTFTSTDANNHFLPTLKEFRNKLLNLTTRNSLLNLIPTSSRTASLIRFIHCEPQFVLNALCSGSTLDLKPLPDPSEHEIEKLEAEEDVASHPHPRDLDTHYQEIPSEGPTEKNLAPEPAQAKGQVRSNFREFFEQGSKSGSTKNLAKWAERQGINPSFDLSFMETAPTDKNSALQVLLLNNRLERLAESLRKNARSSIEETGNNILYLAFGCLEWTEKNKSFFAPLVLLPVELIRTTSRGGAKRFSLRGTEDAPIGNVTLKERLRRDFLIDFPLPILTEDGGDIRVYFDQVATAIQEANGWAVRPFLNLALLNFSGLSLYEDLDPDVIQSSPLVRQLMAAGLTGDMQVREAITVAEDIDVDQPSITQKVPILITKADASQFASIADVMSGRSMVIEGPPGTGKSQTITNIIANALYSGKRVLFVAEKKVALDVVYTRLADAGLKPYCLRITSDKTSKREVYDELRERLLLPQPKQPNRGAVQAEFNQLRDKLNNFSWLLNQSHGAEEESPQNLLWTEVRLRKELLASGVTLSEFKVELPTPPSLTQSEVEQVAQVYGELAKLVSAVNLEEIFLVFTPIGARPWDSIGREQLFDQIRRWADDLKRLSDLTSQAVNSTSCLSLTDLRQQARNYAALVEKLPDPLPIEHESLIQKLSSSEVASVALDLFQALRAEQTTLDKLLTSFNRIVDPLPAVTQIHEFVTQWNGWSLGQLAMPSIRADREILSQRMEKLSDTLEGVQVACDAADADLRVNQLNRYSMRSLSIVLDYLNSLPSWVLECRDKPVWKSDPLQLQNLLTRYNSLQEQRESLGLLKAPLLKNCSEHELKQASEVLQQACDRGMALKLHHPSGAAEWGLQISNAKELLDKIDKAVEHSISGHSLSCFTLEQLQVFPCVLSNVSSLSMQAANHRSGQFWDAPLDAMKSTLKAKNDLKTARNALEDDGLNIPNDVDSQMLRGEAEVLETRKGLHKFLSSMAGSYKRANQLARKLGAKNEEQGPGSLRRLADFLDQQADYPVESETQWCTDQLSLSEAVIIAEELTSFKDRINDQPATSAFLSLAQIVSVTDAQATLKVFAGGLSEDLCALASHELWANRDVLDHSIAELRSQLDTFQEDQILLEKAAPYAAWAVAAGVSDGDKMVSWYKDVLRFQNLEAQFPLPEFEAIVGPSPEVHQVQEVVTAKISYSKLLTEGGLDNLDSVLLRLSKAEIQRHCGLVLHQILPRLEELLVDKEVNPPGGEHQPLLDLLSPLQGAIDSFRELVSKWTDFGLQDGLSSRELLDVPLDLELLNRRKAAVESAYSELQHRLGPDLGKTPPETLKTVLLWVGRIRDLRLPLVVEQQCLDHGLTKYITDQRTLGFDLVTVVENEERAAEKFSALAMLNPQKIDDSSFPELELLLHERVAAWLEAVLSMRDVFPQWIRFHELISALPGNEYRTLVQLLIDNGVQSSCWNTIYYWNIVRSKLTTITIATPDLKSLQAQDQINRRYRFQLTEEDLMRLDRAEVIAKIHCERHDLPEGINEGRRTEFTELGLIDNETNKQKRHRPLRHLFRYAGNSLRSLKPCWMMSPSSVATLVPREAIDQFDLVIIDEASQMPPERAFGIISRARQCVVVGDPKQLPPTDFFQRSSSPEDSEEPEEIDTEALDEESILDLCTKSFRPVRRLKWHYRSRHGSLIAFSNRKFYNNQLVVFPSRDRDFAINRHLVKTPRYAKGINLPEVSLLCDVVLAQLEQHPERTLGVVTMNEAQAEQISEQLETLSVQYDELRRRLDLTDNNEQLFVKALEKVQGDERDTIVISTTYGPAEPGGSLAMRFGPINQNGGHRRLNVLFTRAKHGIELVTSMESSQIRPTATSSHGVHALKDYLKYIETRSLDTGRQTGRPPDSDFEVVVAEALEEHGYQVECQVGVANYFIDLAVVDPQQSGLYLLGIECDGATYHSARAARDRDKYRQSVLEGLGWDIYRIWSTDWFENPEAETRKLIDYLNRISGNG